MIRIRFSVNNGASILLYLFERHFFNNSLNIIDLNNNL